MDNQGLRIGQVAVATGLSAKAIRLYERQGLIDPPERTQAGYRSYDPDQVVTLGFIRQAKTLGLRLSEIAQILDLGRSGAEPCAMVVGLLEERITMIDATLADLEALRARLTKARAHARDQGRRGRTGKVCPIIETSPATRPVVEHPNEKSRQGTGRHRPTA